MRNLQAIPAHDPDVVYDEYSALMGEQKGSAHWSSADDFRLTWAMYDGWDGDDIDLQVA